MFLSKRIKKTVAAISAIVAILMNTVTSIAAPFGYSNVDDVRTKALIYHPAELLLQDRVRMWQI